jgi:hypothetical protein
MSVDRSETARDAAKLMAVVVFPTPPFWLAMHIMCVIMSGFLSHNRWFEKVNQTPPKLWLMKKTQ